MPYAISGRIQSVSQRFIPGSGRDGFAAGVDSVLRMRFTAAFQPLEMRRITALRSFQPCSRSRLRTARRDCSHSSATTWIASPYCCCKWRESSQNGETPFLVDREMGLNQLVIAWLTSLRCFLRVLHCVHEIAGFAAWSRYTSFQDLFERNLFAVPGLGCLVVLLQFCTVQ